MGFKELEKEISKTNVLMDKLIIITNKTRKTLTMVNIINTVTLIVIAYMIIKGVL